MSMYNVYGTARRSVEPQKEATKKLVEMLLGKGSSVNNTQGGVYGTLRPRTEATKSSSRYCSPTTWNDRNVR